MTRDLDTFLSMTTHSFPTVAPHLDQEQFTRVIEQARGLALVDFTAVWCPPCRILGPQIDALAHELASSVVIAKVDVDEQPDLAARFGVRSIPTLVFFRDGEVVDRHVGALPPERMRARVRELTVTQPAAVA
jgi:thioredoxin 1